MTTNAQMKLTRVGSGAGATSAAKLTELRARLQHFGADDPATPETISSHKDIASAMDQAKAATVPFDELVSKLEAQARIHAAAPADAGQVSGDESEREQLSSDEAAAFAVLSATLRALPDTVAKVEQLIRSGSPAAPRLISGLGAAGTSKAHEVLLRLLNDKTLSEKLRTRCGVALLRTPTPSPAAVSGVAAKLDDPDWHRLAVYGLGSYSRRLREAGDVQEARRLASVLTDRLVHADSPSERADLLRGLSNAGAPEAFDAIRPYVGDASAEVRAGALTALRLIDRPDIDAILAGALSNDVQPSVRLAALHAIADRAASRALSEAVASALMHDASTRIRFESVDLAIKWMPTSPKLREAVRHAAADDAEPTIRQRAAAIDGTNTAAP